MAPLRRTQPPHETPGTRGTEYRVLPASPPGGVRERPNRHDWKSCVAQVTVGSNPTLSAANVLVKALQGVPADGSAGPLTAKGPARSRRGSYEVGAVDAHVGIR